MAFLFFKSAFKMLGWAGAINKNHILTQSTGNLGQIELIHFEF